MITPKVSFAITPFFLCDSILHWRLCWVAVVVATERAERMESYEWVDSRWDSLFETSIQRMAGSIDSCYILSGFNAARIKLSYSYSLCFVGGTLVDLLRFSFREMVFPYLEEMYKANRQGFQLFCFYDSNCSLFFFALQLNDVCVSIILYIWNGNPVKVDGDNDKA